MCKSSCSVLVTDEGWKKEYGWRKLHGKLPKHEQTLFHEHCYIEWKKLKSRINENSKIHSQLNGRLAQNVKRYRDIF